MAQLGRASVLGTESRGFKSLYPDDMTYNNWYTNNTTPSEIEKLRKSREQWIKNSEAFSKKAAYAELDIAKLEKLLDEMAYVLDLLVDDSSNNRNWFKVKEVLDKYEKYKREQGATTVVGLQGQYTRKGKQNPA